MELDSELQLFRLDSMDQEALPGSGSMWPVSDADKLLRRVNFRLECVAAIDSSMVIVSSDKNELIQFKQRQTDTLQKMRALLVAEVLGTEAEEFLRGNQE